MSYEITLGGVICRIQQAQAVLSVSLDMLTTDDGVIPDLIASVLTILDGLPDEVAIAMEKSK